MIFALLFVGLLPLMLLPDMSAASDAEADPNGDQSGPDDTPNPDGSVILPDEGDDNPGDFSGTVDDGGVIAPDDSDDNPEDYVFDPNDPANGDVLNPNDTPDEEYPIDGDGSLLQQLLAEQSDATTGIGFLGTRITDTNDLELGGDNDTYALDDDGLDGTGDGTLGSWDGTPIIATDGDLHVVSGGQGDDVLTAGDEAAYLFGGEGNDSLAAGEGAVALFGGAGNDTLTGSDAVRADGTAAAYLDGGSGDDVILGGDANEVISGGEHASDVAPGDDILSGGGGDDAIRGGLGADTLSGGSGDDVLDHYGNAEELVIAEQNDFGWHIDNDADRLDGGDGNDTLIFDRADTATGGAGNDTFWLYHDSASGAGHAEITDFTRGEDFLRISLNPDVTVGDPEVSVAPSEDGQDGVVMVNGEVIAVLRGTPDVALSDIYVDVPQNIF